MKGFSLIEIIILINSNQLGTATQNNATSLISNVTITLSANGQSKALIKLKLFTTI